MKHIRWRLGAFLAATVLLGLAFGTAKTRGIEGGPAEAARYEAKQRRLLTAIAYGNVGLESFTESEINAYLSRLLEKNGHVRKAGGLRVGVEELRCDVVESRASLFVSGRLVMIPFVLEYRVTGLAEDGAREEPAHRPRLRSVWLGRLPLVQPLKWIALGHLKHLLAGIRPEREILEHLEALEIEEDTIHVTVGAIPLPRTR